MRKSGLSVKALALVASTLGLAACEGPAGPKGEAGANGTGCTVTGNTIDCGAGGSITIINGTNGAPGVSTATLSGTITNTINNQPVQGVTVALNPKPAGITIPPTGSTGAYSVANLPIGTYAVTFSATNYKSMTANVSLLAGQTSTVSAKLVPTSSVFVTASATPASGDFGATATLSAAVTALDGSTATAYKWEQIGGPTAAITANTDGTATITLGDYEAQKAELFKLAGVPADRFQIVGVNPYAVEEAEKATFNVTVTTATGSYTGTVAVGMPALQTAEATPVPYKFTTGLHNVPINVPVFVCAPAAGTWTGATFDGPDSSLCRAFTPKTASTYTLGWTNGLLTKSIKLYAGTWLGELGVDANYDNKITCMGTCHDAYPAAAAAATDWVKSGHSGIFRQNFTTPGHYSTECLTCHTVGYDETADNGGIDEATGFSAFETQFTTNGVFNSQPSNWPTLWTTYPAVAKMTNIQCENCHGPQNSDAHMQTNGGDRAARLTMSAELCGACHGEPARHGRYQQWQESGHGQYDLAVLQATVENRAPSASSVGAGHCGRCHSGQGFVAWVDAATAKGGDYTICLGPTGKCGGLSATEVTAETAYLTNLGLTVDEVVPQTCQACHDPHDVGTTSGEPNNAKLRVMGDTGKLPAGFYATGVGRGAVCMTCHNTRNGLHNDQYPPYATNGTLQFTAPHEAAQADMLMGETAYFVDTGDRSPHSWVSDTCANCHMEKTDPPAEFSYNLSGTNHEFSASPTICAKCHSTGIQAADVQAATRNAMDDVNASAGEAFRRVFKSIITNPNYTACTPNGAEYFVTLSMPESDAAHADWTAKDVSLTQVPTSVELVGTIHGQMALKLTLASGITPTYWDAAGVNSWTAPAQTVVYMQAGTIKKHDVAVTGDAVNGYTVACVAAKVPAFVAGTVMDNGVSQTSAIVAGVTTYAAPTNPRLDVPGTVLVEATWNYYLARHDASGGIHNPPFTSKILGEAFNQLYYYANNTLAKYY